jgi:hypothetical protein
MTMRARTNKLPLDWITSRLSVPCLTDCTGNNRQQNQSCRDGNSSEEKDNQHITATFIHVGAPIELWTFIVIVKLCF